MTELKDKELYMKYLGVLGLLCEAAVYLDEDYRESIERALTEAEALYGLRWRRIINRYEILGHDRKTLAK